jgi:hypothetical protein
MLLRLISIILTGVILAACGGGGGSGVSTDAGTVSVFITDDISQDFDKAWITIQKVTIIDTSGSEYTLYEDTQGRVFNLLELSGVGALLNTSTLPSGTYTTVRITVVNEITLVDKAGQTIIARFSPSGTQHVIEVSGGLTVTGGGSTSFGLDFDTKQFTYDPQTGMVTAVVVFKSEGELNALSQMYAKVKGDVTEVVSSSTFQMRIKNSGTVVTVTLHASGIVFDENTGATATDTSLLRPGQRVDVYGDYNPSGLTIVAVSVKIEEGSAGGHHAEAKGIVTAIDGMIITLDVRKAEHFVPPTSTITVDISGAIFSKGSLSMLAVGQWIEVKGSWDGSTFFASVVEIEGAPAGGNQNGNWNGNQNGNLNGNYNGGTPYVEVKGPIQTVNGNIITITVQKYEHFVPPGDTVQADVSGAWFKHGSYANLAPGVLVEVKGSWNGTMIIATVVEFEH